MYHNVYITIRLNLITKVILFDDVIEEYNLRDKVEPNGYVYIKVRKGMYGLPQAELLAQELLA